MAESCGTCKYFKPWKKDTSNGGECHRYPKVFTNQSWEHPHTESNDFCGEYHDMKNENMYKNPYVY